MQDTIDTAANKAVAKLLYGLREHCLLYTSIIARCAILLEGGICISPVQTEGYTFTFMNCSLRLNQKAHFFLVK